ncbi:modification methylase AccI domain protein, partial [Bacteroides fragilis str. 3986T(B)10]
MGLANGKYYVPIVKGGNTKYWKSDMWFMSW